MPFAVEQGQASGTGSAGVGPTHVLLLWENEDRDPAVPDATLAAEYGAWMRAVGAGGTSITGQELGPGRVYLSPGGGALTAPVPDEAAPGPPLADRRLGGYFLITAADLPAAAAVAGGHPHLTYGGSIEVAEILRR